MNHEDDLENAKRFPGLFDKPGAAQYLSVSVRTLERMVAEGTLTLYRLRERTLRLKKKELDDYIEGLEPGAGDRPVA